MIISRRLGFPLAGLLAVLGATLVLSSADPVSAGRAKPKVPATFWGMAPQAIPTQAEFNRMKRGGVDSVRYQLIWAETEPQPGTYDWSTFDAILRGAARARLEVLPFVWGSPGWVTPNGLTMPVENAQQRSAWQGFLRQAVQRYGPGGAFWSENPGVPRRPIRIWQIWNEANFFFFTDPISPSKYGQLLKLARSAIKGEDRGARTVLTGLFASPKQRPPQALQGTDFLRKLYRVRGIKAAFDGVALHSYAKNFQELGRQLKSFRGVMRKFGDQRTQLWITEMGWGSGRGTAFEKGIRGQVKQLQGAFSLLRNNQRRYRIARAYWFTWKDRSDTCNFCDSIGLFRENGSAKPAWFRYVKFAGGRR